MRQQVGREDAVGAYAGWVAAQVAARPDLEASYAKGSFAGTGGPTVRAWYDVAMPEYTAQRKDLR